MSGRIERFRSEIAGLRYNSISNRDRIRDRMRDGNNDWGGDRIRQSQGVGVGIDGNRDRMRNRDGEKIGQEQGMG